MRVCVYVIIMSERIRSAVGNQQQTNKMPDLGPRKTLFVLVIVVGCFAVLWPKVFYPMLVGSAQHHMKPSDIDRMTGGGWNQTIFICFCLFLLFIFVYDQAVAMLYPTPM